MLKTIVMVKTRVSNDDTFRNLGSILHKEGDVDADLIHIIKAG